MNIIRLLFLIVFANLSLNASEIDYTSPTKRVLDYHGREKLFRNFDYLGILEEDVDLFETIWPKEEIGFIGYHGGKHDYRLFQDILKCIFEEHLKIPIRDDFYFFRIPGDPIYDPSSLDEYIKCKKKHFGKQFLCINYTLYDSLDLPNWCGYYFTKNKSYAEINYKKLLINFFKTLEMDPLSLDKMFDLGKEYLNSKQGVLFQIFDISHFEHEKKIYELTDKVCCGYKKIPLPIGLVA